MPDTEAKRTKKVGGAAVAEIRKLGMSKALAKYKSGEGTPEFKTAVERYYSPGVLKSSSKKGEGASVKTKPISSTKPKAEVLAPAQRISKPPSKAAISRKISPAAKVQANREERENARSGSTSSPAMAPISSSSRPGMGSQHPFQQAKAARGKSSLKSKYAKQKEGSKYKGAFSGLGG